MKVFSIDKRTTEDLIKQFNELNTDEKTEILIRWFGIKSLFEEVKDNKDFIKHLRENIKVMKE